MVCKSSSVCGSGTGNDLRAGHFGFGVVIFLGFDVVFLGFSVVFFGFEVGAGLVASSGLCVVVFLGLDVVFLGFSVVFFGFEVVAGLVTSASIHFGSGTSNKNSVFVPLSDLTMKPKANFLSLSKSSIFTVPASLNSLF